MKMWLGMNLTYHGIMGTSIGYPRMEHEGNVWDGESGWGPCQNPHRTRGRFCRYQSNTGKKTFLERIISICA